MPPTRTAPTAAQSPSVASPVAGPDTPPPKPARRTRRRFWALFALTLLVSLALYPPPWQFALRRTLRWVAARHGCELTIGKIEGGLFDTFHLYGVRCVQPGTGTDLRVARVDLTPDWWAVLRNRARRPWLRQLALAELAGQYDFNVGPRSGAGKASQPPLGSWLSRNAHRFVPSAFYVSTGDLTVRRGGYRVLARRLRFNGERGNPGFFLAREMEIGGPGFANIFLNRHGRTAWQGNRLAITGLELTPGIAASSVTVDGTHLGRRRLDWEGALAILGGEVRVQGALDLSRTGLALEIAGTMRAIPVQSLARLLGLVGAAGGQIEQGNFSFRGDPADWAAAEMWLNVQATDFRWNRRRWQNLELQTVVLHRRVQVNRLELRQSRNQLSLRGEFPLPPANADGAEPPVWPHPWWKAGFSCTVDARLDDLRALTTLIGPRFPLLEGRMSVNGTLETMPGSVGIDGYLNVEGSQLLLRGTPLDSLRSTLVFRGEELQVADLQAAHGGDQLNGKWTIRLGGASGYEGALKMMVKDRSAYALALDGIVDLGKVGLGSEDPHAPISLDGTFHGPGPQGEMVFENAEPSMEPVRVPVPSVGDWWRDD